MRYTLAFSLLALGCAEAPAPQSPPFDVEFGVERMSLENGLEVVVMPNHTAPVVTALVAIRSGSAFERPERNGYSHLFEHMIFEGSESVPDANEFGARLDDLGVVRNGTTNVDRVTYFFTAERTALEPALELFAGAIISPALDAAVLEKEKGVVLGEFDLNESDTDFLRLRNARALLFGEFASRLDPLGARDAVSGATVDELRSMHSAYYVPNNAMLVLSGDVTREDGEALARRYFGPWSPGARDPLNAPFPPVPASPSENRYLVMAQDVSITDIAIWWQGPSLVADALDTDAESALAGELLSAVTFQTDHSFRGLVSSSAAFGAGLGLSVSRRTSYVNLRLSVPFGRERATLELLSLVLDTLGAPGDVSEDQLDTAKASFFRSYLFRMESPTALPHSVANEWALADSHRYFSLIDQTYGIDLAALTRFARTYVYRKPCAVVLMSSPDNIATQGIDERWLDQLMP